MSNIFDDDLFIKVHENLPIVCVDIIIINSRKEFLLVKRKVEPVMNQWWFIGGRVLKNESLVLAAHRKVYEETGLHIKSVEKIVSGCELFFDKDPFGHMNGTHSIATCFVAKLMQEEGKIKLDSYQSKYKFFKFFDNKWDEYLVKCLKKAGFQKS